MNAKLKIIALLAALAVCIGLWTYSNQATAQPGPLGGGVVGVCNPHRAFKQYKKTLTLRADLNNEKQALQDQINDAAKQRQAMLDELTASGFDPGSPERERMRRDLVKRSIEDKNHADFSQSELRRKDMHITQVCYEDVYKAVEKVAKRKGLTLVLTQDDFSLASARPEELFSKIYYRRPVLFADEIIDLTQDVVEQLNIDYQQAR